MNRFLVAGLINLETTLRVEGFPLAYSPVRYPFHGVRSTVAGVGYNVARALAALGHPVRLAALIGRDDVGELALRSLDQAGVPTGAVLPLAAETAQSVILYDDEGRRAIHVDLKDFQDLANPVPQYQALLAEADWVVACNINYARPLLALARQAGKPVASDVHAIEDLDDAYNQDYLAGADVLFFSADRLRQPAGAVLRAALERFPARVIVVGLGAEGALLGTRDRGRPQVQHVPAVRPRPVVNTIGAGDALFSAFLHAYAGGANPAEALRLATWFAGYKIGAVGAAEGFLTAAELDALAGQNGG